MSSVKNYKNVERPGFIQDEEDHLKKAFQLFDLEGTGKIKVKDLKTTMENLGFDVNNALLFKVLSGLEKQNDGIDYETFKATIADNLGQNSDDKRNAQIYDLFSDHNVVDEKDRVINLNSLKQIAKDLEEKETQEELKEILKRISGSGTELTFEEFNDIMKTNSAN